jgi:copper(I)-binding protein
LKALRLILIILVLGLLAACSPGKSEIHVSQAWVRPASDGMAVTGAYLLIENRGNGDDRLLSVSSPIANRVEMHETRVENDIASMHPQDHGLLIPAGETVEFRPSGLHLMVLDFQGEIVLGNTVSFTLNFEQAGSITVEAVVADTMPE